MIFSTKAGNLAKLAPVLKGAAILPQISFCIGEFEGENVNSIVERTRELSTKVIVRSSAFDEDCTNSSKAGMYLSIPCVDTSRSNEVIAAIKAVIDSYGNGDARNEILIQPMLSGVTASGVVMSCDVDTLAEYIVVNIDFSSSTNSVTGGVCQDAFTWIRLKKSEIRCSDVWQQKIVSICEELEDIFDESALDIEFAFCGQKLYILQVRPIARAGKMDLSSLDLSIAAKKLSKKIEKLSKPHPMLLGSKAVYGVMPDWNPAEIIGVKPRRLALSLYKELITDSIWAHQRDNYGYRALRSHPLMISFLGVPYIDVRVSFNSFVPKSLNEKIAGKLVDYYLDKLVETPYYHDKVEFSIVFSCYTFDLPQKLEVLLGSGFEPFELKAIENSLLELTKKVICLDDGLYQKDIKKIEQLKVKHDLVVTSELALIDKIYWLCEECKRYGTLPFAGIARAAFMATQFLDSFVSLGIITDKEKSDFLRTFSSVSSSLLQDLHRFFDGVISRDEILMKYGHLRPGTYDILSDRYDEAFEEYFAKRPAEDMATGFLFSIEQKQKISEFLKSSGLEINFEELISFIKGAIEGREYSKFVFTKSLSQILVYMDELGRRFGFSKGDISHLDISEVLSLYSSLESPDISKWIAQSIAHSKREYEWTLAIKLPSLLVSPSDVYQFFLEKCEPNFITQLLIRSEVCVLGNTGCSADLEGKIVFIKNADPGYDFLFAKNIAGFVTCYGGPNSHMSIRASELGLPAVVGVGERLFNIWGKAAILELDCAAKVARVVS